MSNFYMLECYVPDGQDDIARIKAVNFKGLGSWRIGKSFKMELPNPISIYIKEGYPDELKELYNNDALVMTRRLYHALVQCGVDNMDMYPCEIINKETGFSTNDYVAVNLIGLVGALELELSNIPYRTHHAKGENSYGWISHDELKMKKHLMFRFAENTSAVIIHKTVKEYLVSQGFDMLSFVKPKNWIG